LSKNKGGWILSDGADEKDSTNGTWVYVGEEMPLHNNMVFKTN
jgi:hypothetical protein